MINRPQTYKKLPGKKKRFIAGEYRLWLGDDHLLQVQVRMGSEAYRRYHFNDIQAVVARKTATGKIYNGLLAALMLLMLIPAIRLTGSGSVFYFAAAAFFFIFLAINWLMGPTCQTHLKTAIQDNELPSLSRLRTAQKVMLRLRPLVQTVQGSLTPEQIAKGPAPHPDGSGSPALKSRQWPHTPGRPAPKTPIGNIPVLVAGLLTASALVGICEFFFNHIALALINSGLFFALAIAAIIFLVRQYNAPHLPGMLAAAWGTIVYIGLSVIGAYALMITAVFKQKGTMMSQWQQLELMAQISPHDSPFLMAMHLFFLVFALILAIMIGMIFRTPATSQPSTQLKSKPAPRTQTDGRQ